MTPTQFARVKAVFMAAQAVPEAERGAFLDRECAGDAEVRAEVASLLGHVDDEALFEPVGQAPADDPLGLIGAVLDDRYAVQAFVAEGGFGHVYRAEHLRWRRPVAVKVFKPYLSAQDRADLLEDFVREGALLAQLSRQTTAIVQSYDVGVWQSPGGDGLFFTVLEWLDGWNLATLRKADPAPWPLDRVRSTLAPVAQALAVAHANQVAHRDVKPDNIFVLSDAGATGPHIKLLDFGVAKVAADKARGFLSTAGHASAFSVGYAAPEQVQRSLGATGPWTDVHGLALVASELLSGKRPYGEGDVIEAMRAAKAATRPTPTALGVEVPAAVERVLDRALTLDPQARFPDAAAFWAAFEAAAEGRPAPGRWWQFWKKG
ncbi:MAG: serine/threonine protein kinase [Myxococcales bacterium]|nr:serine/threonine protein kinase [Myxococcales bacterium]